MRNRVYFGSYSLEHWLKLLRTGDIILPKYQRHFVWDKERMSKLVDSVRALESGSVILEMKNGKYEPIQDCDILKI